MASAASTSAVRFATRSRARCAKPDLERSRLAQIVSRVGTLWHAATNLPHAGAILCVTAMQISVARIIPACGDIDSCAACSVIRAGLPYPIGPPHVFAMTVPAGPPTA